MDNTSTDTFDKINIGDTITATFEVVNKDHEQKKVALDYKQATANSQVIELGAANFFIHNDQQQHSQPNVITPDNPPRYYERALMEQGRQYAPLKTAVVHPVDAFSITGAVDAAQEKLIEPILIGPEAKIQAAADQAQVDISAFELISTEHSHAAAEKAVQLVHESKAEALMKGKVHTDEFMAPIVSKTKGLRTGRRMSHVLVVDIPSYHKPLFMTDAALNILPNLSQKKDILQNAIDLFIAVRGGAPKVAVVSAVETVDENIPSTLDATALCKMAERGQITGGIVDGPLAFDNAISREAALAKNIHSEVAGDADIILTPNIESGNMLSKQLSYLFDIEAPGIVLGARVPIILTSRAAQGLTRQASCALALLFKRRGNLS